jgi:hypothetical protein
MNKLLIILSAFAILIPSTVLFIKKLRPVQALTAEYFLERPDLLQTKRPELYNIPSTFFRQKPESI